MPETGEVSWFGTLGFGLIAADLGGREIFLHGSELEKSGIAEIAAGDRLSFETETDDGGRPRAVNVARAFFAPGRA